MKPAPTSPAGAAGDLRILARGGALSLVGVICKGLFGFLLAVVVTRGLGTHESGVFFSAIALFTILATTAQLGAHTGLVRTVSRLHALERFGDVRPLLRIALGPVVVLGVVLAGLIATTAPALARLLVRDAGAAETAGYLRLLAVFLPFSALTTTALSATRGFGTVKPFVLVENIAIPVLRPPLVLAAAAVGLGGAGVAVTWGLPLLLGAVVALGVLVRMQHRAETPEEAPPPRSWRELAVDFWSFTLPRGVAAVFQTAVSWIDVLFVAALRSPAEAGIYAAASRAVVLGTFGLQAVRLAIAPQFSALLTRGDQARAESLYQTATWWLIAASWPAYLLLAVFAPVVLRIFGPQFVEGQLALLVLSLAMLVNLGTGNVTTLLLMSGRSAWNLGNTTASLTANVVLNLLLVPRFGMLGAAFAWTASIAVENGLALGQIRRFLHIQPFGRGYPVVAIAALACFGGVGLLAREMLGATVPGLLATVAAGSATYAVVLWRARDLLQLAVVRQALSGRRTRQAEAGT